VAQQGRKEQIRGTSSLREDLAVFKEDGGRREYPRGLRKGRKDAVPDFTRENRTNEIGKLVEAGGKTPRFCANARRRQEQLIEQVNQEIQNGPFPGSDLDGREPLSGECPGNTELAAFDGERQDAVAEKEKESYADKASHGD